MTLCRYFLKGYCRNGNRCRFEHTVPYSSFQEESSRKNNYYDYNDHGSSNNRFNRMNNNAYENKSYKRRNEYTQHEDRYQTNYSQYNQRYTPKRRYQSERYEPGQANKFGQNKRKWVSQDYRGQENQRQNIDEYNSSTPNIRINFNIREPELQRTNHSVGLRTNEENLIYVKLVKEDMKEWELGSEWPFTSYSPIQGMSNFPEFFDLSTEELRYEAYKARESNTADSYVKSVENALQNLNALRNQLKNPSVELISFIEDFCTKQVIIESDINGVFSISNRSSDVDMVADESLC